MTAQPPPPPPPRPPSGPPEWHQRQQPPKKWFSGWRAVLTVLGIIVVLAIVGAIIGSPEPVQQVQTPATTAPTAPALPPPAPPQAPKAKTWVEVHRLTGSADKRGPAFALSSADARLRYQSQGSLLFVYLLEEGRSLEQGGGFPETSCSAPCGDETRLAKRPGNYYLEVRSYGGNWTVIVEELR